MNNLLSTTLALGVILVSSAAHAQYDDMQPTGRIEILTYGDARFDIETEHLKVASGRELSPMQNATAAYYGDYDFQHVAYRRPLNRYGNIQTVSSRQPSYRSTRRVDPRLVQAIARELAQYSANQECRCSGNSHLGEQHQYDNLAQRGERSGRLPRIVRIGY